MGDRHPEDAWVDWLAGAFRPPAGGVGIGDDAAVLPSGDGPPILLTCDTKADGVHFRADVDPPERIGHKALGSSLSDIAAMGGEPRAALCWVAAPRGRGERGLALLRGIAHGIRALAGRHGVEVVGGDTIAFDGPLTVGTAVLGRAARPVLRSGALPGDRLVVSGALGGSSLGRHLSFEPRLREGALLSAGFGVHAMIDISDGLGRDLLRLCDASGCGARIDASRLPVSGDARRLAGTSNRPAWRHALGDGEDFELLAALAPQDARRLLAHPGEVPWTDIGCVTDAARILTLPDGGEEPLAGEGYRHPL